jgi:hypothetical protein
MKIRIEKPEHIAGTAGARHDWATVTGQELKLKQATFHHIPSCEYYCHIVGGIAYPVAAGQEVKPGILIILGIQNEPAIKFKVLEAFESNNVFNLIAKMVEMRKEYGFGLDSRILPNWYGDQDKYQTLIMKASEALEKQHGINAGLYIKDTVDRRERNSFPLYVRQIFHTLETKRFDASANGVTIGHLQSFQREDAEKGKTDDFPAVGLLGGMIHSLQIEKPWLEDADGQGTVFNID